MPLNIFANISIADLPIFLKCSHAPFQSPLIRLSINTNTSETILARSLITSTTTPITVSVIVLIPPKSFSHNSLILLAIDLTCSTISPNFSLSVAANSFIASPIPAKFVFHAKYNAAIAAITIPIGPAAAPSTPPNLLTTLMIVPTIDVTFPSIINTGPIAATIAAIFTSILFCPSSRPFNHSTNDCNFSTNALIYGNNISPIEIANDSNVDFKIVICPSKLSSIVCAIPAAVPCPL